MKTCLNRLIRRCKDCEINYDSNNHPSNYDCKSYQEANIQTFEVEKKDEDGLDSISKLLDKL